MTELKQRRGCSGCRALEWRFDRSGLRYLSCNLRYPMTDGKPRAPCPKPKNYAERDSLSFYEKP